MFLSEVYIYSEPRCPIVDFEELTSYIEGLVPGVRVISAGPILEEYINAPGDDGGGGAAEPLAFALAKAKVKCVDAPVPDQQAALPGEVAYELRRLQNRNSTVFGLIYDAHLLAHVYGSTMSSEKTHIDKLHIIYTNQLIGTWDMADRRYHARTVLCGSPSIVSISGITVAPAKDPGFYIARRSAEAFGFAEEEKMEMAASYAGDYLEHDDPRLTEVLKGYTAQTIAHRLSGEAFCGDPDCRLYNAHWQRELIRAQLGGGSEYCVAHKNLFGRQARMGGGKWI